MRGRLGAMWRVWCSWVTRRRRGDMRGTGFWKRRWGLRSRCWCALFCRCRSRSRRRISDYSVMTVEEMEEIMTKMRAVQVTKAGGPLEMVEREIPAPGAGKVQIKVQACGGCHSDTITMQGLFPGIQ